MYVAISYGKYKSINLISQNETFVESNFMHNYKGNTEKCEGCQIDKNLGILRRSVPLEKNFCRLLKWLPTMVKFLDDRYPR